MPEHTTLHDVVKAKSENPRYLDATDWSFAVGDWLVVALTEGWHVRDMTAALIQMGYELHDEVTLAIAPAPDAKSVDSPESTSGDCAELEQRVARLEAERDSRLAATHVLLERVRVTLAAIADESGSHQAECLREIRCIDAALKREKR